MTSFKPLTKDLQTMAPNWIEYRAFGFCGTPPKIEHVRTIDVRSAVEGLKEDIGSLINYDGYRAEKAFDKWFPVFTEEFSLSQLVAAVLGKENSLNGNHSLADAGELSYRNREQDVKHAPRNGLTKEQAEFINECNWLLDTKQGCDFELCIHNQTKIQVTNIIRTIRRNNMANKLYWLDLGDSGCMGVIAENTKEARVFAKEYEFYEDTFETYIDMCRALSLAKNQDTKGLGKGLVEAEEGLKAGLYGALYEYECEDCLEERSVSWEFDKILCDDCIEKRSANVNYTNNEVGK